MSKTGYRSLLIAIFTGLTVNIYANPVTRRSVRGSLGHGVAAINLIVPAHSLTSTKRTLVDAPVEAWANEVGDTGLSVNTFAPDAYLVPGLSDQTGVQSNPGQQGFDYTSTILIPDEILRRFGIAAAKTQQSGKPNQNQRNSVSVNFDGDRPKNKLEDPTPVQSVKNNPRKADVLSRHIPSLKFLSPKVSLVAAVIPGLVIAKTLPFAPISDFLNSREGIWATLSLMAIFVGGFKPLKKMYRFANATYLKLLKQLINFVDKHFPEPESLAATTMAPFSIIVGSAGMIPMNHTPFGFTEMAVFTSLLTSTTALTIYIYRKVIESNELANNFISLFSGLMIGGVISLIAGFLLNFLPHHSDQTDYFVFGFSLLAGVFIGLYYRISDLIFGHNQVK